MVKKKEQGLCCGLQPSFLGIFLLLWGIYLLAKNYGYVSENFPFWPIILVLLGIYFLKRKKVRD